MMKRYSPLGGLAERRRKLGMVTEPEKTDKPFDLKKAQEAGADEFTWNKIPDLTRAVENAAAKAEKTMADETAEAPVIEAEPEAQDAEATEQSSDTESADAAPVQPKRRSSRRVKTTLLGFDRSDGRTEELFKDTVEKKTAEICKFPTGWLVVVEGPGRGTAVALHEGVSQIGRGDDQAVQLDFGDNSISRENHAAIAYDVETRSFYLGHGGKTNIVRLNGTPVLSTEPLNHDDHIRIGETTMRFVAFCNDKFSWSDKQAD